MGASKVVDIDHGYRALMKRMHSFGKPRITVGLHAKEGEVVHDATPGQKRPVTVLAIGTWAEFGLGQPQRSWLGAWYDMTRDKSFADIKALMKLVTMGKLSAGDALNKLGHRFVGQIQLRIAQGIEPPNAPSTIRRKGSSKPLIGTGQFRASITHAVEGVESGAGEYAEAAE